MIYPIQTCNVNYTSKCVTCCNSCTGTFNVNILNFQTLFAFPSVLPIKRHRGVQYLEMYSYRGWRLYTVIYY